MLRTVLSLLLCCGAAAAQTADHLPEKARMEAFYGHYNLGVTAQLDGRLDDACGLFAKAAEGAKKVRGWWQEYRALLALGGAYHARRDLELAEKYYLQGMESFKYMKQDLGATGLSGLGRIYLDRGQPAKAAPLLREARDLEYADYPRRGELTAVAAATSDLARLDEMQGDPRKAELRYLVALKLLDGKGEPRFPAGLGAEQMDAYPIILYRLGDLYKRSGNAAAADVRFRQALQWFPLWSVPGSRPAVQARKLEYRSYTLRALGRKAEAAADLKEALRLYRQVSAGAD